MVVLAKIHLWGDLVGAVLWDASKSHAIFEYAPSFRSKGLEVCPLTMPLHGGPTYSFSSLGEETFLGLPGMLADCLPDTYGRGLLDRWLALQGRTTSNPVERLCYQGKRSMGALEFEPSIATELEQYSKVEIDSLVAVASEVLSQRALLRGNLDDETTESILNIIRVGTSAGGQRAKAVIAFNEETGEVLSGQTEAPAGFHHYIIKLDGVEGLNLGDPKHYGRIEYVYYLMAKAAGIDMMESRLVEENGRAHFMTRRFDRPALGGKLHTMTLCGMAHWDYRSLHTYSYEQAFMVLRRLRLKSNDFVRLYRQMVFNVLSMNHDDHTKNISFVMSPSGRWNLSPAYDLTWAFNPRGLWTSAHQMSVNGKWTDITEQDLLEVANRQNISEAKEIIEQTKDALALWPKLAKEYGVPEERIGRIGKAIEDQICRGYGGPIEDVHSRGRGR